MPGAGTAIRYGAPQLTHIVNPNQHKRAGGGSATEISSGVQEGNEPQYAKNGSAKPKYNKEQPFHRSSPSIDRAVSIARRAKSSSFN
jgi:hypothetical protein